MANPQLSIIVPVYNRELCIAYCLESLQKQTFQDFEIIIIDDGSIDRTGEICAEFLRNDERIKYIKQTNAGVSVARNYGIREARGEYISFVDSDDIVEPFGFETLVKAMSDDVDVVIAGYHNAKLVHRDSFEYIITSKFDFDSVELYGKNNIFRYFFEVFDLNKCNFYFSVAKLYRKKLLSGNEFPAGIALGEDRIFFLNLLSSVTGVRIIPYAGYIVVDGSDIGCIQASSQKREPMEALHCFVVNYEALFKIYTSSGLGSIKKNADDTFLSRILEYIILPNYQDSKSISLFYTKEVLPYMSKYHINWRNVTKTPYRLLACILQNLGAFTVCKLWSIRMSYCNR